MSEAQWVRWLCYGLLALAPPVFVVLLRITVPYGRHHGAGWGPTLPSRLGWIIMEAPAVALFIAVYALGEQRLAPVPLTLLGLWQLHYVHRTLIYPWRLHGSKPMPLLVVALGAAFSCVNASLNARHISHFGVYAAEWFVDPRFICGALLMVAGFGINTWADTVLLRLRAPGSSGYRIAVGGLFRWISCPNYLGEIIEWCGWAAATWSLPGLCFAVFAMANLSPRARSNHRWYRRTFADYPRERRALIPFVW